MRFDVVSKDEFVDATLFHDGKADRFARTFIAKCNMMDGWENVHGMFDDNGMLMGAILVTLGKQKPPCANLQLLHTFAEYRRRGVGKALCTWAHRWAREEGALYFRVSAEPDAVEFYRHIGFKFWGEQKSKAQLSIFRIGGENIEDGKYNLDYYIAKKIEPNGRKGSIVVPFDDPR